MLQPRILSSDGEHQKEGEAMVQKLLCCKEGEVNFWLCHTKMYDSASLKIERSIFLCFK